MIANTAHGTETNCFKAIEVERYLSPQPAEVRSTLMESTGHPHYVIHLFAHTTSLPREIHLAPSACRQ